MAKLSENYKYSLHKKHDKLFESEIDLILSNIKKQQKYYGGLLNKLEHEHIKLMADANGNKQREENIEKHFVINHHLYISLINGLETANDEWRKIKKTMRKVR
ncbi:hypothetical protein R4036_004590 [Salmonella enterica]|nr:hypothetical protein [Salmonella enterica]